MRRLLSAAVVAASLCNVPNLGADDGLFSEVAMESVYANRSSGNNGTASKGDGQTLDRITGNSSLIVALNAAGFEATKQDSGVEIEIPQGEWKLPVSMEVQIEQDRILCTMTLVKIGGDKVGTESLLKLLASGDPIQGTYFGYDTETNLLTLRTAMSNRSLTASKLKRDLRNMASIAAKKADLWWDLRVGNTETSAPETTPAAETKPATETKPTPQSVAPRTSPANTKSALSLVGRWTASAKGGSSFAIQITAGNQFQLVHLKDGKSGSSKGKVTRSGSNMTLAGDDGTTLNCTVSQDSADKFLMGIKDSKGNVSANLEFKKAK